MLEERESGPPAESAPQDCSLPITGENPKPQERERNAASGKRRPAKRFFRIALRVLIVYAAIVLMLAFFQRSLIYHPFREAEIRPEHAGRQSGSVHEIRISTEDDLRLNGWHILPDGLACETRQQCDAELAKDRLLVLFFSGNAANRRYRVPEFEIFSRLGAHVFIFDYRGYGDNEGSPTEDKLASDAHSIWNYATGQRSVPPEHIVLYGESLGGGVATRLAAELCRQGTTPAALICRSTFSSLTDAGAYHYPWLPVRLFLIDRFDAHSRIGSVSCPILLLHGTEDGIVPIELGRRLFAAARQRSSNGVPRRFVELPGAGHNDVIFVASDRMRSVIGDLFETIRNPSEQHEPAG